MSHHTLAVLLYLINTSIGVPSGSLDKDQLNLLPFCFVIDLNPCRSIPCANNAVCLDIQANVYQCQCPSGFTGPTCSQGNRFIATKLFLI